MPSRCIRANQEGLGFSESFNTIIHADTGPKTRNAPLQFDYESHASNVKQTQFGAPQSQRERRATLGRELFSRNGNPPGLTQWH